jgi:hypothetical protein
MRDKKALILLHLKGEMLLKREVCFRKLKRKGRLNESKLDSMSAMIALPSKLSKTTLFSKPKQ